MASSNAREAFLEYQRKLAEREPEMVELLSTLVNFDTPSARKDLLDKAMSKVEETCRSLGAEVERVEEQQAGDHIVARWKGGDGNGPRVLVLAHLDTVWPADETSRRPFAEEDGKLAGPGVFDMKAGLVQALFAIDAFRSGESASRCDVTLVVSSDEENGSRTSRGLIEEEAARSQVVLVVEPASGPALKTARKGVGMYQVVVEGRASHAGLDPEAGRSALLELAHQIIGLHELNDPERGTSVTVGMASGGSARNVVPASAEATVDLRVVTTEEAERCDRLIKGLQPVTPDTKVTVTGGINRPPMERSEAAMSLYRRAEGIAGVLGFELGETLVGGGSDGNFTAGMGIPTLDGLGAVGGGAHALSEHVVKAALVQRSALLAGLLHDIAENGVEGD